MSHLLKANNIIRTLFLILFTVSHGQQNYANKIDHLISSKQVRPFSGVILVSQDNKTVYSKSYGYSNLDEKKEIQLNDSFVILSNSKQITAVLILQEVEKGTIQLNGPIKKYLPDVTQSWGEIVTVHHLLNHTSGVENLEKPLQFKPGTQFMYSDLNYILLGKIIEYVSKNTYEKKVIELFEKCGMKDTFYPNTNNVKSLIVGNNYQKNNMAKQIKTLMIAKDRIPAAGIISTAKDLSTWNYRLHNGSILKPKMYKQMISYTIKNQHTVFGNNEIGYGYGIRVNDLDSIKEFGHTGIVPDQGFTSVNLYYPESKTSLIVLENQAYDDFNTAYFYEVEIRKIIKKYLLKK